MNIKLQQTLKVCFRLLLLALIPLWSFAQVGLQQKETGFMDMPLTFQIQSVNVEPSVISAPSNLEFISKTQLSPLIWEFVYQPRAGFIGFDDLVIQHLDEYPPDIAVGLVNTNVQISIVPSLVEAQHDYGIIEEGETLTIKVVENDSSSHGELVLNPVFPVVNNGKAAVGDVGGTVEFKPDPGFTGLADFNYIACDEIGTCATGAASVYVNAKGQTFNDAIRLGTGQNTRKAIPMPFKVTGTDLPEKVRIEVSQYAVVYQPDYDEVGQDVFTVFGENGQQRVITMDIIERPANDQSLATNDVYYALLGEAVELDVLKNDGMARVSRTEFYLRSFGGAVENMGDGTLKFVPNEGFRGTARIAYRAFDANFNAHWAEATIVYDRNNFGPNDRDFSYEFEVRPDQTKTINFDAPIDNFQLKLHPNAAPIGEVEALATGSLVYYPAEEEAYEEEFEVLYCAPANAPTEDCQSIKIAMSVSESASACAGDCVFPGDLNRDGIVNNLDLLPLGLYIGATGPSRAEATTSFEPQAAEDWDMSLVNGTTNLKHYDANGDGILTETDAEVIQQNYGKVSDLIPYTPPAIAKAISITQKRVTPSVEEVPPGTPIPLGTRIELEIGIGEEAAQELDLYGITFPFRISGASWIDPTSFTIEFNNNSWTALNSPTLELQQELTSINANDISFDLGFTRTNLEAVSGMGAVATVGFVIVEDVLEFRLPRKEINLTIEIGDAYAIDRAGQYFEYGGAEVIIPVSLVSNPEIEQPIADEIQVYPNPAINELTVQLPSVDATIQDITVFNLAGSVVYRAMPAAVGRLEVPVANLPEGLYIAQLQTDSGMVSKKFVVKRGE